MDHGPPILEHSFSTRRAGWHMVIWGNCSVACLLATILYLGPPAVFFTLCIGFLITFGILVNLSGINDVRMNGFSVLRMFRDRIVRETSHPSLGRSYEITYDDIDYLDNDTRGEGTDYWAMVLRSGERLRLSGTCTTQTKNDVPVDRILRVIRSARPDLQVVPVTNSYLKQFTSDQKRGTECLKEHAQSPRIGDLG